MSEDWAAWFRAVGAPAPSRGGIQFDTIHMALEGAAKGLGIALGHRLLIEEDLRSGRLVLLPAPAVPCVSSYWLVGGEGAFERPEIRQFRTWLLAELGVREPDERTAMGMPADSTLP